jgi:hypothetical protein
MLHLFPAQPEHEIGRETGGIAPDSLIQDSHGHAIELRQIAVEHHPVSAYHQNASLNRPMSIGNRPHGHANADPGNRLTWRSAPTISVRHRAMLSHSEVGHAASPGDTIAP